MADGAIFDNVVEHVCFRIRSVVRLRHPELDAAAILNKEAPACWSGRKCANNWEGTGATPVLGAYIWSAASNLLS